jgi:hypothetical protein
VRAAVLVGFAIGLALLAPVDGATNSERSVLPGSRSAPDSFFHEQPRPSGVPYRFENGCLVTTRRTFRIPEGWAVIDVDVHGPALVVCAYRALESNGAKSRFRSEVWIVGSPDGDSNAESAGPGYGVLLSLETGSGESKQLCRGALGSNAGVAVYVQMHEGGRTRLFSWAGEEIAVAWPKGKGEDVCCLDHVRPLGWTYEVRAGGRDGTRDLVLVGVTYFHGDIDPWGFTYDVARRVLHHAPLAEILGTLDANALGLLSEGCQGWR